MSDENKPLTARQKGERDAALRFDAKTIDAQKVVDERRYDKYLNEHGRRHLQRRGRLD